MMKSFSPAHLRSCCQPVQWRLCSVYLTFAVQCKRQQLKTGPKVNRRKLPWPVGRKEGREEETDVNLAFIGRLQPNPNDSFHEKCEFEFFLFDFRFFHQFIRKSAILLVKAKESASAD
jgi:hypothetical protein